jgi:signal transduction histidine kinase
MVKKAADRMQGSIRAESTPGKGTVFYLEIPQKSEEKPIENRS